LGEAILVREARVAALVEPVFLVVDIPVVDEAVVDDAVPPVGVVIALMVSQPPV
jgi:hypothetical protein